MPQTSPAVFLTAAQVAICIRHRFDDGLDDDLTEVTDNLENDLLEMYFGAASYGEQVFVDDPVTTDGAINIAKDDQEVVDISSSSVSESDSDGYVLSHLAYPLPSDAPLTPVTVRFASGGQQVNLGGNGRTWPQRNVTIPSIDSEVPHWDGNLLHIAAEQGNAQAVQFLQSHGADMAVRRASDGRTPSELWDSYNSALYNDHFETDQQTMLGILYEMMLRSEEVISGGVEQGRQDVAPRIDHKSLFLKLSREALEYGKYSADVLEGEEFKPLMAMLSVHYDTIPVENFSKLPLGDMLRCYFEALAKMLTRARLEEYLLKLLDRAERFKVTRQRYTAGHQHDVAARIFDVLRSSIAHSMPIPIRYPEFQTLGHLDLRELMGLLFMVDNIRSLKDTLRRHLENAPQHDLQELRNRAERLTRTRDLHDLYPAEQHTDVVERIKVFHWCIDDIMRTRYGV